jgi:tricorn protease-like protein
MVLVGGQTEAGEELRQPSRVVERISRFSGVELHVAPSGSPEQERVTKMGAVNVEVNSTDGATIMVNDPDWPAVSVRVLAVEEDGVKLEVGIATVNSHSVGTLTSTADEVEVL